MFAELIRRKFGGGRSASSDAAFESTTVSLSSAVPRPVEKPVRFDVLEEILSKLKATLVQ